MRYLLDTNVWVDYLNQRFPNVSARIVALGPRKLLLSSVVLAELRYGADKSGDPRRNHARIDILEADVARLDFDETAALAFGQLRVALEAQGTPIGAYDMLIAG